MTRLVRTFPMTLAALALVVGAQPLLADAGIRDEAGVFSPEAVRKAEATIKKMAAEHKKELYIETLATLPSVEKGGPDLKNENATKKWINDYAIGRFKSHSVNGVYFLLIQEPRKYQFEIGNNTQNKAFTQANRVEAENVIKPYLKERKMDDALSALVNFVSSKVSEHDRGGNHARVNHQGGAAAGGENSIMSYVCLGALVIGGIFLVMGLFRAFTGMGGGGGGGMGGPGMGSGGGGFMSNFLGGMFGAAAGMWMYDSFFGHGGSRASGSGDGSTSSGNDFGGQDTDASGGGGDYGGDSSSSGGDWGGGGGGDWGGGGGGDFGGGGGGGDY